MPPLGPFAISGGSTSAVGDFVLPTSYQYASADAVTSAVRRMIADAYAQQQAGRIAKANLIIPPGAFTFSRYGATAAAANNLDYLWILHSNMAVDIQGRLKYDPTQTGNSRGLIPFQFGDANESVDNIDFGSSNGLGEVDMSWSQIVGTGSLFVAGSRRASSDTGHVWNVNFHDITARDVQLAFTGSASTSSVLIPDLYKNWNLWNVVVDRANNRAVEFTMVDGFTIDNLRVNNVASAVHLLSFARNGSVSRVYGTYNTNGGGLYYNFDCDNVNFSDIDLIGADGASGASGAIEFHFEAVGSTGIDGAIWNDIRARAFPTGVNRRSLTIVVQNNPTAYVRNQTFEGGRFFNDVLLYPSSQPNTAMELTGWIFNDTVFDAQVLQKISASGVGNTLASDFVFNNCWFKGAANILMSDATYNDCRWEVTPTIDPLAKRVVLNTPSTPTAINTVGLDPTVQVITPIVAA